MLQRTTTQKKSAREGPENKDKFEDQKRPKKNFDETKIMRW